MSNVSSLDELARAAAAAGFAMAAPDDDFGPNERRVNQIAPVSVEELARGGQRMATADQLPAVIAARPIEPAAPKGLLAGANSVRDTVYGYLRLGVPA